MRRAPNAALIVVAGFLGSRLVRLLSNVIIAQAFGTEELCHEESKRRAQ
ncbi:MAG TPA: hypothetical protein VFS30_17210 [Dehalococcoidia bacterium]|nr:hypothetical protein [Dehalococcoidia bacterium]